MRKADDSRLWRNRFAKT